MPPTDSDDGAETAGIRPSRRQVIGGIGGAAALLGGVGVPANAAPLPIVGATMSLRRKDDFVNLRFELHNVRISADGRTLHRGVNLEPLRSRLIVYFPPQAVAEETSLDAYWLGNPILPARPVEARISHESRLAFDITDALPMPLSVEELLQWNTRVPLLVPNARDRSDVCYPANLREPRDYETSIELPWKLQLSPHAQAGWAHRLAPATGPSGWTELWHTRLGVRSASALHDVDEANDRDRNVRAVWARYRQFPSWLNDPTLVPELEDPGPNDPDNLAMDAKSRYEIVRLSSDSTLDSSSSCRPNYYRNRREPVDVELLMLTSLGGWLDSSSFWRKLDTSQGSFGTDLESWQHRATLGRDHYVRLVRRGFLCPFGHRAVYVELSERKLLGTGAARGAYLRKRYFIIVRQLVKEYEGDDAMPDGSRGLPFTSIRTLTRITPNLRPPSDSELAATISHEDAWIPTLLQGGERFQFLFRGTDRAGRSVDFRAPVVFVADESPVTNPALVGEVLNAYNAYGDADLRTGDFGRKHTAVADPEGDPRSTTAVVHSVQFAGQSPKPNTTVPEGESRFYPKVAEFSVELPEVRALAGDSAQVARFAYPAVYLEHEFGAVQNPGQSFLEVAPGKSPTALGFATDRSGGVATPNIQIRGLSRKRGPVTEMGENAAEEKFDPAAMFDDNATLLGGVTLADVLEALGTGSNPQQALDLVTRDLGDNKTETRLSWKPKLKSGSQQLAILKTEGSELELRARVVSEKDKPPFYEISGRLSNAVLSFIDGTFIEARIALLRFSSSSDQKPDVDCDISEVTFLNELEFVRELAEICNFGGGDGVWIEPQGDRIAIGLDIPLPSLTIGILGLENIKVSVALVIPFNSTPVLLRFAFCSREDPFTLTVMFFRGSGFVAVEVGAHGMDMIEFSFEFGVGMSIDLGVASGSVEIVGGLYYQLANNGGGDADQTITFIMYLRLRGELDVLGLISASLEFYLALGYKGPDLMYGEATLTVTIDLFIFSADVEVTCRREFKRGSGSTSLAPSASRRRGGVAALGAGDGGDPIRFEESISEKDWATYCQAFATL